MGVFRRTACMASVLSLAVGMLLLGGCGSKSAVPYVVPDETKSASGSVAENDRLRLSWDADQACVLLEEKSHGVVWSTVPYGFYQEGRTNVNLSSPVIIEYLNAEDNVLRTERAFSAVIREGSFSSRQEENGIAVSYYFVEAEITVVLHFTLRADSLAVTLRADQVVETTNRLISVSVTPYLCSTPNTADKDTYLVVPAGIGALMYTDTSLSEARRFSGEVYGSDVSARVTEQAANEEAVRMPLFGVKSGDKALCAIIEQGAESAVIQAEAGNSRNEHSAVYAAFRLRANDTIEAKNNTYVLSDTAIYAKTFNSQAVYTVGFYPLSGEEADYNGMAKRYRRYLQDTGCMQVSKGQQPYHVSLLGGAVVRRYKMGIPCDALCTATTLAQAEEILADLLEATKRVPAATLMGFGENGMDPGRVAGGFKPSGQLGGFKGLSALSEFCAEMGIPLYMDYDVVRFNKSGNGFSSLFDTAKSANRQSAEGYSLTPALRCRDENLPGWRLLKRSQLDKAVDKLTGQKNISVGFSLSTLGTTAWSDYGDTSYYVKGSMDMQVTKLLGKLRDTGRPIGVAGGNVYAAVAADCVTQTSLSNGGYDGLDVQIPLFPLVFKGITQLYSQAVNLSADPQAMLLRAVEAGVSPSFTLTATYDTALSGSSVRDFYGALFEGNRDLVQQIVTASADFYAAIGDSAILRHERLDNGVTKTWFENGVTVLVNHSNTAVVADGEELTAQSFVWKVGNVR